MMHDTLCKKSTRGPHLSNGSNGVIWANSVIWANVVMG